MQGHVQPRGLGCTSLGPLGFEIDSSRLKRAGLDYWPYVTVKVHDTWERFMAHYRAQAGSKRAAGLQQGWDRAVLIRRCGTVCRSL